MKKARNKKRKSSEQMPEISDLIQLMYVGLLGCNREVERKMQLFYEQKGYTTNRAFFFYEYLAHRPLFSDESENNLKQIWFFAPFIQRLSRKSLISLNPEKPDKDHFIMPTDKQVATSEVIIEFNESIYMNIMYSGWSKKRIENKTLSCTEKTLEGTSLTILDFPKSRKLDHLFMRDVRDYKAETIEEYIKEEQVSKNGSKKMVYVDPEQEKGKSIITWKSKLIEYGFIKPLLGGLPPDYPIPSFLIPIASDRLFYGELLVWIPFIDNLDDKKELAEDLAVCIKDHYVPALALLHEHFYEKNIKGPSANRIKSIKLRISDEETAFYRRPFCRKNDNKNCPEHTEKCPLWKNSNDEIENHLHNLWKKRMRGEVNIQESMVFKSYLVASPRMIDKLKNVLNSASRLKKIGDSLPSVLVVGEPGSGKDEIANFLRLFSKYYSKGELYKINMASIKPDALVPPVVVGANIKVNPGNVDIEIIGILEKIKGRLFDEMGEKIDDMKTTGDEAKLYKKKEKHAFFPTLVLDELNSMSIDSQGVLLRFLENAEIVPIGGVEERVFGNASSGKVTPKLRKSEKEECKRVTDFLVIGVMNEDPDELSREKAIDFIRRAPYVRGLFGDLLYEYFLKIRRLRGDLKYRMIRCGKFVIPDLKNRREDVPILFDYYAKKEIHEYLGNSHETRITLDALERLMSPELEWPGNIRQLQALSKKTVEFSILESLGQDQEKGGKLPLIMIREKHIRKAMKEVNLIEEASF